MSRRDVASNLIRALAAVCDLTSGLVDDLGIELSAEQQEIMDAAKTQVDRHWEEYGQD